MCITFIITFDVKNEKLSDFANIMSEVKSELPKTKGCIGVTIHNSIDKPSSYTLIEMWESKKCHEKHVKNLVDTGEWDNVSSHLAGDPVGEYYKEICL